MSENVEEEKLYVLSENDINIMMKQLCKLPYIDVNVPMLILENAKLLVISDPSEEDDTN